MLARIVDVHVDPNDWNFTALVSAEKVHRKGFVIKDGLRVSFDHKCGAEVSVRAVQPEVSAPYLTIKPINMGAARWYSIECDISDVAWSEVGQLVPCLDAASAQSVSLFSLLRVFYDNGKSEDFSSLQVELRRNRAVQAFPISMAGSLLLNRTSIKGATLILYLESRNVAIDFYGLSILSVAAAPTRYAASQIERLRAACDAGSPTLFRRSIQTQFSEIWTGPTMEFRQIGAGVFLDFEPGAGRSVGVERRENDLVFDFSRAASCGWRSVEFRFDGIIDTGFLSVLLHAKGVNGANGPTHATLILREYGDSSGWKDTNISTHFTLFSEEDTVQRFFDLSPLFKNRTAAHHFGIVIFLPPETIELSIEEFDVFVFDRQLV